MTRLRQVIDAAAVALAEAGVGSPRIDAELLAAHAAATDRGRLAFADTGPEFCERYDQTSFDPDYPTLPLEHFEPMVREVFSRTPRR